MGTGATGSSFIRTSIEIGGPYREIMFQVDFFPSCQCSRGSGTVPCRDGSWSPDRAIDGGVVPMAGRVLFEFVPPYR